MGKQGKILLRSCERKFYKKYLARYLKMDDGGAAGSSELYTLYGEHDVRFIRLGTHMGWTCDEDGRE